MINGVRDFANRAKAIKGMLEDRLRVQSAYHAIFSTPDGQLVLRHLMKVGHVTSPTFVAGDSHQTSFREGQRHLALSILRQVNKDQSELIKQIEEGLANE